MYYVMFFCELEDGLLLEEPVFIIDDRNPRSLSNNKENLNKLRIYNDICNQFLDKETGKFKNNKVIRNSWYCIKAINFNDFQVLESNYYLKNGKELKKKTIEKYLDDISKTLGYNSIDDFIKQVSDMFNKDCKTNKR